MVSAPSDPNARTGTELTSDRIPAVLPLELDAGPLDEEENRTIHDESVHHAPSGISHASSRPVQTHFVSKAKHRRTVEPTGCLQGMVTHVAFVHFINFVILLSAIQMGLACDLDTGVWIDVWWMCEHMFTTIFLIELLLKLGAFRLAYFCDWWNVLDSLVVFSSVLDAWVFLAIFSSPDESPQMLKFFRLIRLLRVVKMLRVVPELMLVVEGIVASMKSMFWVFLLLAVILYTVSIYCVEAIGADEGYVGRIVEEEQIETLVVDPFNNFQFFGTLARSMISLFSVILLAEWSPVVRPVWERSPGIIIVFIFLVVLTTFGVLNVIIGVVVEKTTTAMNALREQDVVNAKNEQMSTFSLIEQVLFELDEDVDAKISRKELEQGASNQKLHDLLQTVQFPHGFTYAEFHAMLDQDGSGDLSRREFMNGMFRLVYNDPFQRDCMFQLAMGQVKANQVKLHREMKEYTQKLYTGITGELNKLRSDLVTAGLLARTPKSAAGSDARRKTEPSTRRHNGSDDTPSEPSVVDANVGQRLSKRSLGQLSVQPSSAGTISQVAHVVGAGWEPLDTPGVLAWQPTTFSQNGENQSYLSRQSSNKRFERYDCAEPDVGATSRVVRERTSSGTSGSGVNLCSESMSIASI